MKSDKRKFDVFLMPFLWWLSYFSLQFKANVLEVEIQSQLVAQNRIDLYFFFFVNRCQILSADSHHFFIDRSLNVVNLNIFCYDNGLYSKQSNEMILLVRREMKKIYIFRLRTAILCKEMLSIKNSCHSPLMQARDNIYLKFCVGFLY